MAGELIELGPALYRNRIRQKTTFLCSAEQQKRSEQYLAEIEQERLKATNRVQKECRRIRGQFDRSMRDLLKKREALREQINDKNLELSRITQKIALGDVSWPPVPCANKHKPTARGENLPSVSGIYFLWNQEDVVEYVGQSVNLRDRCRSCHPRIQQIPSPLITFLEFSLTELNFAECFYIGLLRPIRNFTAC